MLLGLLIGAIFGWLASFIYGWNRSSANEHKEFVRGYKLGLKSKLGAHVPLGATLPCKQRVEGATPSVSTNKFPAQ